MIKCVIVEDERIAREKLTLYVNEHPELTLLSTYVSGEEFLNASELDYNLLFLDIGLPNIDGITLAASLAKEIKVIFTTAYAEHAVEAFNLNAVDYLLKPFDYIRFSQAIKKSGEVPNKKAIASADDIFMLKDGKKIHRIAIKDIYHIKGLKEYVVWHTKQGQIVTLHSLKEIISYLSPFDFIQTHKSHIVNAHRVTLIESSFVYINEISIPIGRMYREKLREHFKPGL